MREAPGDVQAIDMREGKVKTFQLQIGCHEAGRAVHEYYKINLIPGEQPYSSSLFVQIRSVLLYLGSRQGCCKKRHFRRPC